MSLYQELRKSLDRIEKLESKKILAQLRPYIQKAQAQTVQMPLVNTEGKGRCVSCGYHRKLGQRGKAKGKCKACRKKEGKPDEGTIL